jgi:hypothetical protein
MVGIKHILDLSLQASNTNVIILSAPHRHDLSNVSCVNREVEIFNKKLRNRLKCLRKVELIEVPNERDFYTKHGQHLNSRGKEIMANKVALTIENVVKRKVDPISIKWCDAEEIVRSTKIKPHRKDQVSMTLQLILHTMQRTAQKKMKEKEMMKKRKKEQRRNVGLLLQLAKNKN